MPNQFIATIFELTDAGEIDVETAQRAIENVIVAAAPSLFVGIQRQILEVRLNEILANLRAGVSAVEEATESTSHILRAVIERKPHLAQLLEPVGARPAAVKAT